MAEVERSGDGYRVTLTAEESRVWMHGCMDEASGLVTTPVYNTWHPLLAEIGSGLRACQPPDPPQPGDRVQLRHRTTDEWSVDGWRYLGEFGHGNTWHVVALGDHSPKMLRTDEWFVRRDVRVGGDQ